MGIIKPISPVLGVLLKSTGTILNSAKKLSKIENGIVQKIHAKNNFLKGKVFMDFGVRFF
jgi:hypothetical protein